ncbi:MAG: precorrin-4 C(11)-methyltransferase [Planctomycetota bacterium]|jgi:precorrin-4/cobalt-precorrin-4 C11-methyltransferase|nr:precorrin-4 C(11)-methyltransferase [Planctomycetota bacterium]
MIWFVGAGSGAADLITVRGARLLAGAGQVIYAGSLVNPEILELARPEARRLDSSRLTLEEVVDACLAGEREGLLTIRLHSGDPSLYGAIREQMDELERRGVPFGMVPGVSSLAAAAAALNIEYTRPGASQTLILTRVAGRTPVPEAEGISRLARHGSGLAVFLSAGRLPELQAGLLAGGRRESDPAAIVHKASWPDERVIRCRVGELAEAGRRAGIDRTALILVGGFLEENRNRSRLYDPSFATGFRKAAHAD